MSNTKHTPGPWFYETIPGNTIVPIYSSANVRIRIGHADLPSGLSEDTYKENEANAKLIAAAPELLEAAIAALAEIDACYGLLKISLSRERRAQNRPISLLEAAIKKATE